MAKNLFKKENLIDLALNVGIGGAANVAFDSIVTNIEYFNTLSDTTKNAIKFGIGVVGSSMVSDKYVRAAMNGFATVGASQLISGLINDDNAGTAGLPSGMVGRPRYVPARRALAQSMSRQRIRGVKDMIG